VDHVDGQVTGDGRQPGPDRAAPRVEHLRVPPGLLESLLSDVLRGGGVPGDGHRDAEHDALEPAHESERQLGVAGSEAREQRLIRQLVS